jgi:hypothetical protein
MAEQTRSAAIEVTQAAIIAAWSAGPGRLNRTGSGSRIPARIAPPAAAGNPSASQILALPP